MLVYVILFLFILVMSVALGKFRSDLLELRGHLDDAFVQQKVLREDSRFKSQRLVELRHEVEELKNKLVNKKQETKKKSAAKKKMTVKKKVSKKKANKKKTTKRSK